MGNKRKLKINYDPTDRQAAFHTCPADEVLYGGAAGGGKSLALIMDMVKHCLDHPRAHVAIFRRTYPQLEKGIILEALRRLPLSKLGRGGWTGVWDYNKSERRGYFPNGSILEFCHLEKREDVFSHMGVEYSRIGWDELTTFEEFQYVYLLSRLRSTDPRITPRVRATTNPGGIGHQFVKKRFIDPAPPGKIWRPEATDLEREWGVEPLSRCFIPAKLKHNPYMPKQYAAQLLALPEMQRRALLDGDWDVYEGQAFPEWRRETHVCKRFDVPREWKRFRSIDLGWTRPSVCLWWAIDPFGFMVIYRELAMKQTRISDFAFQVHLLTGEEPVSYTTCDPSMLSKGLQTGESVAETLQKCGISPLWPGDNNRIPGKMRVHELLNPVEHPTDGKIPRLRVMENCTGLIEETASIPLNTTGNVEDVDTHAEDDFYDAMRYGAMSRPAPSAIAPEMKENRLPWPLRTGTEGPQPGYWDW